MGLLVASNSCFPVDSIIERKAMLRCFETAFRSINSNTLFSSTLSIGRWSRVSGILSFCSLYIRPPLFVSIDVTHSLLNSFAHRLMLRFGMTSLGKHCNNSSKLQSATKLLRISVRKN